MANKVQTSSNPFDHFFSRTSNFCPWFHLTLFSRLKSFSSPQVAIKSKILALFPLVISDLLMQKCSGLNTGLAPMYITEVSPTNLRGSMGSVVQLSITIAILFAQVLGLNFLFGTAERWPLMFAFAVIPAVLQLIVLPCLPESPKNTLINRDNFEQAEKDLRRIRQRFDVTNKCKKILPFFGNIGFLGYKTSAKKRFCGAIFLAKI